MKTNLAIALISISIASCLVAEEWTTAEAFADACSRYNGEWTYPQDALASNVYSQVKVMYAGNWQSPFDHFLSVRGDGVASAMEMQNFMPFVHCVSNHSAEIAANWRTYETNEMVRFTTLSAVGFSGFDNYTNFVDAILSQYESDTNVCSWSTIKFLKAPYGTAEAMSIELNYDIPVVSNILLRIRAAAIAQGDDRMRQTCDFELSGEGKQDYLDMQAAGAFQ